MITLRIREICVDFVFMLTNGDKTVKNCLEKVEISIEAGIKHIGFKDIGVDLEILKKLNKVIKDAGARSYLEVVSTSEIDERNSIAFGTQIGVDMICGGKQIQFAMTKTQGTNIKYLPFVGTPIGHPTTLSGSPSDISSECADLAEEGCYGVDLLAFRSIDENPIELVKVARKSLKEAYLLVAGDIDSIERIEEVYCAGASGFTIGSAVFNGRFSKNSEDFFENLSIVQKKTDDLNWSHATERKV